MNEKKECNAIRQQKLVNSCNNKPKHNKGKIKKTNKLYKMKFMKTKSIPPVSP